MGIIQLAHADGRSVTMDEHDPNAQFYRDQGYFDVEFPPGAPTVAGGAPIHMVQPRDPPPEEEQNRQRQMQGVLPTGRPDPYARPTISPNQPREQQDATQSGGPSQPTDQPSRDQGQQPNSPSLGKSHA
jgi:hypothetical protein